MIRLPSLLRPTLVAALLAVAGCSLVRYDASGATEGEADDDDDEDDGDDQHGECEDFEDECEDGCANLEFDDFNCGGCGIACEEGSGCVLGTCVHTCDLGCDDATEECVFGLCLCRDGLESCGGECVNLENDFDHCSECFNGCEDNQACGEGECVDAECSGFADACDGSCTDVMFDPLHCGDCDNECDPYDLCIDGECQGFIFLEDFGCFECPCPEVCPEGDGFACCYSDFVDAHICVEAEQCPP